MEEIFNILKIRHLKNSKNIFKRIYRIIKVKIIIMKLKKKVENTHDLFDLMSDYVYTYTNFNSLYTSSNHSIRIIKVPDSEDQDYIIVINNRLYGSYTLKTNIKYKDTLVLDYEPIRTSNERGFHVTYHKGDDISFWPEHIVDKINALLKFHICIYLDDIYEQERW